MDHNPEVSNPDAQYYRQQLSIKFIDDYWDIPYKPPENLHVIILDDPRRDLLGSKREDLLYCINCRRCGLYCPRIRAGSQTNERKASAQTLSRLTARELLMDGFLYGPERAIEDGLFDCTLCRSCSNICPVDIDLTEYLLDLRETCQKKELFTEPHKRIKNNILDLGNAYGSDYTMKASARGGR